jgi:hypothetical protein
MQRMLSNSSKGAVVQKALNDIEEYFLSKLREKWGYVGRWDHYWPRWNQSDFVTEGI